MAKQNFPNDDELIPRLLANDEDAYRLLVENYHGIMTYLARSIVGDAIADEVTQEAWLAVIKALPKFERRSSLKTWIMRIVSNCAKTRLRRESRMVNFDDPLDQSLATVNTDRFDDTGHWVIPLKIWHADTPDAILASDELQYCINQALRRLPPLQQAVITLRDMQGLDMESICKILEVSESNARVLLHRARSEIRDALDKHQKAS